MSCFIVSKECMDLAVYAASQDHESCEDMDERGREFYQMNLDAFNACYNGRHSSDVPEYRFRPLGKPSAISQYKAVQCLLYQCTEGDIEKREQFKRLEKTLHELAADIVCELPEYKTAQWG